MWRSRLISFFDLSPGSTANQMVEFLNTEEHEGYEPRFLEFGPYGATIYSRKKEDKTNWPAGPR